MWFRTNAGDGDLVSFHLNRVRLCVRVGSIFRVKCEKFLGFVSARRLVGLIVLSAMTMVPHSVFILVRRTFCAKGLHKMKGILCESLPEKGSKCWGSSCTLV